MIKQLISSISVLLLLIGLSFTVLATPVDTYQFKSDDNQKRALGLAHSLRCPQCQNQNLIDSNSPVAQDLRLEVYQMVDAGNSDEQIIEFMTSRYGDFVLYKPKVEGKTLVLWLGPFGLLLIALVIGFIFIRKQRMVQSEEISISTEDKRELDKLLKRDQ